MNKIAIVDDDLSVLLGLSRALETEGFEVCTFTDAKAALMHLSDIPPDLAVLDISMPEIDGINLMERLRRHYNLPVIFLTARSDELDVILGLKLGADDYISKPCSPRLLSEKIRSVLRRYSTASESVQQEATFVRGQLSMDVERHSASWNGHDVVLTLTEFTLLKALADRPGHVRSRSQLMDQCYGTEIYVEDRTIDTHVKRLRKKLQSVDPEFNAISTIYGVGYKFVLET